MYQDEIIFKEQVYRVKNYIWKFDFMEKKSINAIGNICQEAQIEMIKNMQT
jgi:hypothetical protein